MNDDETYPGRRGRSEEVRWAALVAHLIRDRHMRRMAADGSLWLSWPRDMQFNVALTWNRRELHELKRRHPRLGRDSS